MTVPEILEQRIFQSTVGDVTLSTATRHDTRQRDTEAAVRMREVS